MCIPKEVATTIDAMLIQNKPALVTGACQTGRPAALRVANMFNYASFDASMRSTMCLLSP